MPPWAFPPSEVGKYDDQLRMERKRQVWFILLADERGVCRLNCEIPYCLTSLTLR